MSDFYTEQLVKRKTTAAVTIQKAALIAVTIVSFLLIFLIPFAIIVPVVLIVVDVIMFKRMNLEFEYLYVNGDLDIDKIMSKEKRKRAYSMNVKDLEVIAPMGSHELDPYQNLKPVDFSSGEEDHKKYVMVVAQNGKTEKVIFEPNATILDGMRLLAPRKVFI